MANEFQNPWYDSAWGDDWGAGSENYSTWSDYEQTPNAVSDTVKKDDSLSSIKVESRKDIVIVVDPGHGNTKGNTGSVYRKAYKHKVKGDDGKPKLDSDQKPVIVETAVDALPDYVYQDLKSAAGNSANWVWVTKEIPDNTKLERDITWSVGEELYNVLKSAGYTVIRTRENKMIEGDDDRAARNKVANDNKAHYFISIHADGSHDPKVSGSHAVYRTKSAKEYDDAQIQLAKDVYKYYSVVKIMSKSPAQDNNLQVLSPTQNNAKRKVLVELGFVTNTSDFDAMKNNAALEAKQIAMGLEYNISRYYYQEGKVFDGYEFQGKVYPTIWSAMHAMQTTTKKIVLGVDTIKEHYSTTKIQLQPTIR